MWQLTLRQSPGDTLALVSSEVDGKPAHVITLGNGYPITVHDEVQARKLEQLRGEITDTFTAILRKELDQEIDIKEEDHPMADVIEDELDGGIGRQS